MRFNGQNSLRGAGRAALRTSASVSTDRRGARRGPSGRPAAATRPGGASGSPVAARSNKTPQQPVVAAPQHCVSSVVMRDRRRARSSPALPAVKPGSALDAAQGQHRKPDGPQAEAPDARLLRAESASVKDSALRRCACATPTSSRMPASKPGPAAACCAAAPDPLRDGRRRPAAASRRRAAVLPDVLEDVGHLQALREGDARASPAPRAARSIAGRVGAEELASASARRRRPRSSSSHPGRSMRASPRRLAVRWN